MNNLSRYLTYGYTNRLSKYLLKVLPERMVFSFFKSRLLEQFNSENTVFKKIILPPLKLKNNFIDELINVCEGSEFANTVTVAMFGSVASNEVINYSDFDGIIIYDEKEFTDYKKIKKLRSLINQINLTAHLQDCLQHHGIIVVGKNELINQKEEVTDNLITEANIVYGINEVFVSDKSTTNYHHSLNRLIKSIETKLNNESKWDNQYYFKNMLSELLLLPCLYLQYTHQKYISKKDSFEIIRQHLEPNELKLIYQLEKIRKDWNQPTLNKSTLNKENVEKIKLNSETDKIFIKIVSEIKSELILLIERLKPNV